MLDCRKQNKQGQCKQQSENFILLLGAYYFTLLPSNSVKCSSTASRVPNRAYDGFGNDHRKRWVSPVSMLPGCAVCSNSRLTESSNGEASGLHREICISSDLKEKIIHEFKTCAGESGVLQSSQHMLALLQLCCKNIHTISTWHTVKSIYVSTTFNCAVESIHKIRSRLVHVSSAIHTCGTRPCMAIVQLQKQSQFM